MSLRSSQACSAPGKVLLAGGYLILDRNHTGLVLGLSARIHVRTKTLPTCDGVSLQEIIVRSPQFLDANWRYGYRAIPGKGGIQVTQLSTGSNDLKPNPFVETALSYALTYISLIIDPQQIDSSQITILADNDYYSQSEDTTKISQEDHRFKKFDCPIWEAHKTGLGSSAALVTAFTAAVLKHYLPAGEISFDTEYGKRRLHNLAQISHSAAQGKVGSGFDVASAVYGSCVYRRFSPSIIESIGELGTDNFATKLKETVEKGDWDTEIHKQGVSIPKGLRLVMCDVDCGSKTPGMVKKVLEWRKQNQTEANRLWKNLQDGGDSLTRVFQNLQVDGSMDLDPLKACVEDIRRNVREMSSASDVPIEPEAQTKLLEACINVPGVIGGVTPGAGGYDALALLVKDDPTCIDKLQSILESYEFKVNEDEDAGKVQMLGVREEFEGVREEDAGAYSGWI